MSPVFEVMKQESTAWSYDSQAGEDGFVYPSYTFITQHWFGDGWWLAESDQCTVLDLIGALNNTLSVALQPKVGLMYVIYYNTTNSCVYPNSYSNFALKKLTGLTRLPSWCMLMKQHTY